MYFLHFIICSAHVMIHTLVYDKVYLISFFYLTLENFWNCLDLMRKNVKSFRNPKWYDRQHLDSWTCQIRVRLQLDKKKNLIRYSLSQFHTWEPGEQTIIKVTWVMWYYTLVCKILDEFQGNQLTPAGTHSISELISELLKFAFFG